MVLEEFADNRKKRSKSFALDENLIEKLEILSKRGDFGSQSNIVSVALYEFFGKHIDIVAHSNDTQGIVQDYLKSPEGEALIRSIIRKSLATPEEKATPSKPLLHKPLPDGRVIEIDEIEQ